MLIWRRTFQLNKDGSAFIYLLLTEFKGRTVSYGPSFFPIDLWLKREAREP